MSDVRSRKWQLTINNPKEHSLEHDKINEKLNEFDGLIYYCFCDEIGENKTYHTHLYIQFKNARNFQTIKNKFQEAHIENAKGTAQENREYIRKEGKYLNSDKKSTNLIDTFEEFGQMPDELKGERTDLKELYNSIENGYSNNEIMQNDLKFMFQIDKIEKVRTSIFNDKYKNEYRILEVNYIWGETGTGKTRYVMEKYGYNQVYRVTDYDHPFDGYKWEDVILFDEFRSSLIIADMLKYLDGYPVELPCRYSNKNASYTKVYIISNIILEKQFIGEQQYEQETYNAFIRRLNNIMYFSKKAKYLFRSYQDYKSNNYEIFEIQKGAKE